jgi:hypothetical protein
MAQDSDEGKKGGSCFRQGCGLLLAVLVIGFFVTQCGPALLDYFTGEEDTADRSTTPEVTSTPSPAETIPEVSEPEETAEGAGELPEAIGEKPVSEEILTRGYSWEYGGIEYTWSLKIPEAMYDYFKGLPRPPTSDYSVYVTHPLDDPYIDAIVEKLKAASTRDGFDEYQSVEMVTAFVQSLPYTFDTVTTPYDNYPRYPVETLVDNGGDCEDTSILLASLLDKMGYGVVLIKLPEHVAVGIKGGENVYGTYWEYKGDKYYYVETTNTGWGIGQLPEEYESASAHIYPMVPVPIITHEWDLEAKGYYIELKVKVNNLGTATASSVYVYAGFDAGDGTGWSLKQSDVFNLEPGHQVTATLGLLPPPSGVRTRLMVWIVMGGYKVDESYSVWVDT